MIRNLLLTCALASCFSQPPRPTFDDDAIMRACMDQAQAQCALRSSCTYQGFNMVRTYGDEATCVTRGTIGCVAGLHIVDTGQTPDHVEGCAQSVPSESCSDFFDSNPPARCDVPVGPGALSSPCTAAAQCASGFCELPSHEVCGTCQPAPELGAPCQSAGDCGRDTACPIPSGATRGTCTAYAADGMPCLTGSMTCIVTEVCIGDVVATSTPGTCRPGVHQVGAACDTQRKVATCDPNYGLTCIVPSGTMGTCQPIGFAQPGQPCGTIGTGATKMVIDCVGGGACLKSPSTAASGTCIAPAADGAMCALDPAVGPPCLSPASCVIGADGVTGSCTTPDPAACF